MSTSFDGTDQNGEIMAATARDEVSSTEPSDFMRAITS